MGYKRNSITGEYEYTLDSLVNNSGLSINKNPKYLTSNLDIFGRAKDQITGFTSSLMGGSAGGASGMDFSSLMGSGSPQTSTLPTSTSTQGQGINKLPEIKMSKASTAPLKSLDPTTGLALDKNIPSMKVGDTSGGLMSSIGGGTASKSGGMDFGNMFKSISGGGAGATGGSPTALIGQGIDAVANIIPEANNNQLSQKINKGQDIISDTLMKTGSPEAMTVAAVMKGAKVVNRGLAYATGGATTIDNASNNMDAILSSDILGITPIGLANSLLGTKVKGSSKELASKAKNSSYGDSLDIGKTKVGAVTSEFKNLANFAGDVFRGGNIAGAWGKAHDNSMIKNRENAVRDTNIENWNKSEVIRKQNQRLSAVNPQNTGWTNQKTLQNFRPDNILLSKQGSKLEKLKEFKSNKKVKGIPVIKGKEELNDPQGSLTANNARDFDSGGFKVLLEKKVWKFKKRMLYLVELYMHINTTY